MALDVGKIFFEGQDVIAYSQLGNWPTDLSASNSIVQNVYQGNLWWENHQMILMRKF